MLTLYDNITEKFRICFVARELKTDTFFVAYDVLMALPEMCRGVLDVASDEFLHLF
jgi:hypothetical protein